METETIYSKIGGETGVRRLVDRFYDLMDTLPEVQVIREMHPNDLAESRDKLFKFLSGFFGGPSLYIREYGHPRLRARHLPFAIGQSDAEQWLLCMDRAIDEQVADSQVAQQLKSSFHQTAHHMRNQSER